MRNGGTCWLSIFQVTVARMQRAAFCILRSKHSKHADLYRRGARPSIPKDLAETRQRIAPRMLPSHPDTISSIAVSGLSMNLFAIARPIVMPSVIGATREANRQGKNGDPGMTRTCDLRFRKPSLYPAELRDRTEISTTYSNVPIPLTSHWHLGRQSAVIR